MLIKLGRVSNLYRSVALGCSWSRAGKLDRGNSYLECRHGDLVILGAHQARRISMLDRNMDGDVCRHCAVVPWLLLKLARASQLEGV